MSAVEQQAETRGGNRRALAVASGIGRFLVIAATTYLGLLAVTFFIGRVIPIDPVLAVLGDRAPASVVERTRREMGLDLPLIQQFWLYLKAALNGDFGTSVLTTHPVMDDIRRVFPATIELATVGTLIGTVLGVPLGVLAAVKRGSLIDQLVRVVGLIGYSVPIFWLGLLALVLFYARLNWVAFPGRLDIVYQYTFTPITGFYLIDSAWQGQWDVFWDAFRQALQAQYFPLLDLAFQPVGPHVERPKRSSRPGRQRVPEAHGAVFGVETEDRGPVDVEELDQTAKREVHFGLEPRP